MTHGVTVVGFVVFAMFGPHREALSQQSCTAYRISLYGAIGNRVGATSFQRNGVLTIHEQALGRSQNSAEVWIQTGNPVTSVQPGALFVASNTAFLGSAAASIRTAQMSLAKVTKRQGRYEVTMLDQFAITKGGMFNVANMTGGVTAPKIVDAGTIKFEVNEAKTHVSGSLALHVRNHTTTSQQARIDYRAEFNGPRLQHASCVSASR